MYQAGDGESASLIRDTMNSQKRRGRTVSGTPFLRRRRTPAWPISTATAKSTGRSSRLSRLSAPRPARPGHGDADADGDVDGNDFLSWQQGFGSEVQPTPGADFDSDAEVDGADGDIWRVGFGTTSGAELSDCDADLDGDVDGNDFLSWQHNLTDGTSTAGAAAAGVGGGATSDIGDSGLPGTTGGTDSSAGPQLGSSAPAVKPLVPRRTVTPGRTSPSNGPPGRRHFRGRRHRTAGLAGSISPASACSGTFIPPSTIGPSIR